MATKQRPAVPAILGVCLAMATLVGTAPHASAANGPAAAPVNDDFANATVISGGAGTTYHIAIDGRLWALPATGAITLRWDPPPANDDFVNAAPLSIPVTDVHPSMVGATKEPGEPAIGTWSYVGTLWWKVTAPS